MSTRRMYLPLAALALAGCGYVGAPAPPTPDVPEKVTDLRVLERGDRVVVDFIIPLLTTEGLPLRLSKVELEATADGEAKPLDTDGAEPGPVHLEYPAGEWRGREVSFRVRAFSRKGRDGGWSNSAELTVIPPPATPAALNVEGVPTGVLLTWAAPPEPPDVTFRVRRRTGKEPASEVAAVTGREWVDTATSFGESYEYTLQAVAKAGQSVAESGISEPVSITPMDRFPPAVPLGLTALAASGSVELTWDRNAEPDFAGYFLYRAAGDKPLERLGGMLAEPAYSDRDVKPGTRYRYAVSSVDKAGNESQKSQPVEVSLP
jgi:hypothetical protein